MEKSGKIYLLRFYLLLIFYIFTALFAIYLTWRLTLAGSPASVSGIYDKKPPGRVIIIDAGHGGLDSGAVAPDGTEEKNINLQFASKLRDILRFAGFDVVMTRESDVSLQSDDARRVKRSDLENRVKISENYPSALFLSIHMNKFPSPSVRGMQLYCGTKNESSLALAQSIADVNKIYFQTKNRFTVKKGKNILIMENIKNPCALVECGFMSSPAELANLKSPDYQTRLSYVIFVGVCEYLGRVNEG